MKLYGDNIHYKAFAMVSSFVVSDRRLSCRDKCVYMAICDFARGESRICYAAAASIAERASLARSSVFQALTHLENLGYIDRRSRSGRTDIIRISPVPIYDLHPKYYGGELARRFQTVDKLWIKCVNNRACDYLSFNLRTHRVQFSDGCEVDGGHEEEELLKIIKGYSAAFPSLPTGLEKKSALLDTLALIGNEHITAEVLPAIIEFVRHSEFVRGTATKKGKTLRWILQHLDECLDADSQYLDYDATLEARTHELLRSCTQEE